MTAHVEADASYIALRRRELASQLRHAAADVPWYRDTWKFDIPAEISGEWFAAEVPVLLKSQVGDRLLAEGVRREQLFHESTSGTEGKPLTCFKTREEHLRCTVDLWRRRQVWAPGLSPRDRFARFYAFRSPDRRNLVTNEVLYKDNDILIPLFDLSPERLADYWKRILDFGPRWMHGPSTAIFNLAKFVQDAGLPAGSIEFVELNGEFAPPEQIELISRVLGCAVADNYGSREFWTLAYSCPQAVMHIPDRSVLIESDADQRLLVTSLTNKAWPLIRYAIGDAGTVRRAEGCLCGSRSRFALDLQRGRRADYFTLPGGRILNAILFSGIIRGLSTLLGKPMIYQYQVVRRSAGRLEMRLVLNRECGIPAAEVVARYDAEIRKIVQGAADVTYELVDHIQPDPRTGKARDFVDAR